MTRTSCWWTAAVAACCVLAPCAALASTQVGTTKDACSSGDVVTFQGAEGTIKVGAPGNQRKPLPGLTREITWYCGGSRERSANDEQFDEVRLVRAKNGAMQWTFFRLPAPAQPPGAELPGPDDGTSGLTQVGKSNDACDSSHTMAFTARNKERVRLKANETRLAEMPGLTREIFWKCDDSSERVANTNAFNWVQVERAGNGAIHWVFYRSATSQKPKVDKRTGLVSVVENDASLGEFLHNVPGNVTVGLGGEDKVFPQAPGILKQQIDGTWDSLHDTIQQKIMEKTSDPKIKLNSVDPASSQNAELRVAKTSTGVTLKYVVHGNKAAGTYIQKDPGVDVNFVATFDIEVALPFARSQTLKTLSVKKATAFAHHVELAGDTAGDALLVGFAKSRVRAAETRIDAVTADITKDVNKSLGGVLALLGAFIPKEDTMATVDIDAAGTVLICAKSSASQVCKFASASAPADARKVLGHSADQCGSAKIWLWDAEKGRFVSVGKGAKAVTVELDDRRFEWFCGGNAQADENNDEWATGDPGTFAVRVTRDASGSEIRWQFLSWK